MQLREEDKQGGGAGRGAGGRGESLAAAFPVETWRPGSLSPLPQVGLERWPMARTSLWAHVVTGVHPRKQTPL